MQLTSIYWIDVDFLDCAHLNTWLIEQTICSHLVLLVPVPPDTDATTHSGYDDGHDQNNHHTSTGGYEVRQRDGQN